MYYLKQVIYGESTNIKDVARRIDKKQSNLSTAMIQQRETVSQVLEILDALGLEGEFVFALNDKEIEELKAYWIRPGMDLSKKLNCIHDLLMHGYSYQDLITGEGIETNVYLSKSLNIKDNMKVKHLKRIANKTGRELYLRYRYKDSSPCVTNEIKMVQVNIDTDTEEEAVIKINENFVSMAIKRLLTRHIPVKELITRTGVSNAGFHRLFTANVMTTEKAEEMFGVIGYQTEFLIVRPEEVEELKKITSDHKKPEKRLQCIHDLIKQGVKRTDMQRMTDTSPGRIYKILLADDIKIEHLTKIADNLKKVLVMRYWNQENLNSGKAEIEVLKRMI